MRKAAAPMIGGINCPPVEATASTAPATAGRYPPRRMSGILIVPVVRTLATAVPDIIPIKLLPTTAAFAGPPLEFLVMDTAISIRTPLAPVFSSSAPRTTMIITKVELTPSGVP